MESPVHRDRNRKAITSLRERAKGNSELTSKIDLITKELDEKRKARPPAWCGLSYDTELYHMLKEAGLLE